MEAIMRGKAARPNERAEVERNCRILVGRRRKKPRLYRHRMIEAVSLPNFRQTDNYKLRPPQQQP